MKKITSGWIIVLVLLMAFPMTAASNREREIAGIRAHVQTAENALLQAERAGAPLYAKYLYDGAAWRLKYAKENLASDKDATRREANLRAVEADYAGRAAEQKALLALMVREATNLRTDIGNFGGTIPELNLPPVQMEPIDRGATSMEKLQTAVQAVAAARDAGGGAIAPDELKDAEERLGTVRQILKAQKQSDVADHLSFTSEMTARRIEFLARQGSVDKVLPGLRLERTQLAKAASERQAAEEAKRRQQVQQEAEAMRAKLAEMEASKQAQAAQLQLLRQQIAQREQALRSQLERDRQARIDAAQQLDQLMTHYTNLVAASSSPADVEALRRQVEDQRLALQTSEQREAETEQSLRAEISRLQQTLANERAAKTMSPEEIQQRETQLEQQRQQLDTLRQQREKAHQQMLETQRAHEQAIAEAMERARTAEAQTAELKQQIEQERARAAKAQQELQAAREEIARRKAAEEERARMQQELARIANTRAEERGLVVTLPGIYFDTGKSELTPGAKNVLQRIAEQLKSNEKLKVMVEGHTDSVGSPEMNMQLSQDRANSVRDALVSHGIPASAISTTGKGETVPIATNKTSAGRQQNRRVELIITQ